MAGRARISLSNLAFLLPLLAWQPAHAQPAAASGQAAPQSAPQPPSPQSGQPPAAAPKSPAAPSPAAIERAAQVLAEARKAMGGEKLEQIRTTVANGRTRRVRGDNLVPIEFEIAIELPDKYVRKDEVPAEESEPTSTGFAGTEIIQFPAASSGGRPGGPAGAGPLPAGPAPASGAGRPGGPAGPPPQEQIEAQRNARLNTTKQDFARLALGLFANSLATFPMTFAYAARAEAVVRVDSFEGQQLPPKAQIKSIHVVRDQFAAEAAQPGTTFVDVVTQPGIGPIRGGTYVFSSLDALSAGTPVLYTKSLGDPEVTYLNLQGAVYFQDHIRVRKGLTLSPGVRYGL
jgi:hypothetical protein